MLKKSDLKYAIQAVLSALAIILNISLFKVFSNKVINFKGFYNLNIFLLSLATIVFFFIYRKREKDSLLKTQKLLTIFFALWLLLGEAYVEAGTFKILFANPVIILVAVVKILGYYFILTTCFNYIYKFIKGIPNTKIKIKNPKLIWYLDHLKNYPFRTSLLTILLFWAIYFIAFYPIVLSPDPSYQIIQYFNIPNKYNNWVILINNQIFMTAHHPILQTFLLGWCIELGRFIINDNFGLFLYTIIQTLIYSSALAMTIKYAAHNGVRLRSQIILLIMYSIVPMYPFYALSAVKDTLYTAFMIFFVLFIFDIIHHYSTKKMSIKYGLLFFLVMLMMSLFRHNGIYIIILTIPFLIVVSRPNRTSLLAILVVLIAILNLFNNVLTPHLQIAGTSVREMLSIPFQQTARVIKEYPYTYDEHERDIIDYVLNYDTLASRYEPEKSDPVKNEFNKYTTMKYLKQYFCLWFKGLIRHPVTYIDATLNNIYGYFYPNAHKWYIYSEYVGTAQKEGAITYHFASWTKPLRLLLTGWGNIFPYIPVIGLLSNIGVNTWSLLLITVYLCKKKYRQYLVLMIPLMGTLLICLISPVNTYFRYTMPYIYTLPIIFILLYNTIRGGKNEKK